MATPFEPSAHPPLTDLGSRLRELAGDASYLAGRDYLRKGLVKQGTVAGTTSYATVAGSTDYRVSIAFADEPKVTCTCPAHRRNKFCKHVVAVCIALLERPGDFVVVEPSPEVQQPKPKRRTAARRGAGKAQRAEMRAAGLETVDRLLEELADGGLMGIGPEKVSLLESTGELVRALKLRRMGNLVLTLQRAASQQRGATLEQRAFANLLVDLYLTRRAVGAHLEEQLVLDPRLGEDLLGKTWREDDLEPVAGLELVELAYTRADDGEFLIETSYLVDLADGTIYAEKQIVPLRLSGTSKTIHRHRLLVDEAGLYPGVPPRRIRLQRVRRAPLSVDDIDRLLARAVDSVPELRRRLVERLQVPFGPLEVAVLFRPTVLVTRGQSVAALDGEGHFLALDWPDPWSRDLPSLLPESGAYALFGLLRLDEFGVRLDCLSVVSDALRWGHGPIYPDVR